MIRCALEGVVWLLCKHALVHRICMQKLSIKMCDCSAIAERTSWLRRTQGRVTCNLYLPTRAA
eukprot:scaffold177656_cov22-Tisochrysis_lutea.AAC.1